MMACRSVRPLLPLVAGGDLRPQSLQRVRSHVAQCPRCRNDLQAHEAALAVLAEARDLPPTPSPSLWQRLGPRLAGARYAPAWRPALSGRYLAVACAMVAAVAVGVAMMPRDPTGLGRPVAQVESGTRGPKPTAVPERLTLPPVFVLDRAARTWQHNLPDAVVPPHASLDTRFRQVYVLEPARRVNVSDPNEAF